MLILTRTVGEFITVTHPDGTEIIIHVMGANGPVRLGIDAPPDVTILRDNAKIRTRLSALLRKQAG